MATILAQPDDGVEPAGPDPVPATHPRGTIEESGRSAGVPPQPTRARDEAWPADPGERRSAMFLEMAKDMPRGRQDSLARLWPAILAAAVAGLAVVGAWLVADTRAADDVQRQVAEQVGVSGVMLLDEPRLPRDGELTVRLLVDGRPVDGLIRVDDGDATVLRESADGTWVPVAEAG